MMLQILVSLIFSLMPLASASPADLFDQIFGSNAGSHVEMPFQPAPEKPWKWPTGPLPKADPENPTIPHLPPGHPGPPIKPKKSGECNAATPLGCW